MSDDAVGAAYDRSAPDYDALLERNRDGARRLVAALPDGDYRTILDVGCGTGFATLAAVERFAPDRVVGLDVSAGMLEELRAKLAGRPGLEVELHQGEASHLPVAGAGVDAVVSSMALHWFPDKPAAVREMARVVRPGGPVGILMSGRGSDAEYRDVLAAVRPPVPPIWLAAFDLVQRDERELEALLLDAGLEPLDVWLERRVRHLPPERYMARMTATAGQYTAGMPEAELERIGAAIEREMTARVGPRGFSYTFAKLFGIARRPG